MKRKSKKYNVWRPRKRPSKKILDSKDKLFGATLANLDLAGLNFQNAKLAKANLSHTNLSNANLIETYFTEAKLLEVDFTEASDFTKANLSGVNLTTPI